MKRKVLRLPHACKVKRMPLDLAIISLLLLLVIQNSAFAKRPWLEAPVFRFGGRVSYSLYLYHALAVQLVRFYGRELAYKWQVLGIYAVSVGAAYVSYRFVESPFLRYRERVEKARVQASEPTLGQRVLTA